MFNDVMTWHDDGHVIKLRINKSELEVVDIICSNQENAKCLDPLHGCFVKYFVSRFGLECNAGSCDATDSMEICWTLIGDSRIMDECQLWFMPKQDEIFAAWLVTLKN